jgi:DNA repair photolyase
MSKNIQVAVSKTQQPLIKQKPNSFVGDFDYTLAVYSGCEFGCSYCYVPDVQRGLPARRGGWGSYVDLRTQSVELLQRQADRLRGARLFMSATTDPYQPQEARQKLTRQILEALAEMDFSFLLISTRSGLVLRDLDLFTDHRVRERLEIGISIPSDLVHAHDELEPRTCSFRGRLLIAQRLMTEGIAVRIQMAPLAQCTQNFIQRAAACADWIWIDGTGHGALHTPKGKFWLRDYAYARGFATEAALQIGSERVGFGRDRFAWRWDAAQQCIVPPAGQARLEV